MIFWSLLVFFGLALAFGYPLANGITHLADNLPRYVSDAENGRGWLGHLVRRYHVQQWVAHNVPKLVNIGQGLTKPALTLGKGALTLVVALFTIFILVLLLLPRAQRCGRLLGNMSPQRAERWSQIAGQVNRSVDRLHAGNFLTSSDQPRRCFRDPVHPGRPLRHPVALWFALVDFLPMIGGALAGIPTVLFVTAHSLTRGYHHPWSSSWSTRRSRTTS